MEPSLLYPPNSHLLTDDIVSTVGSMNTRSSAILDEGDSVSTLEQQSLPTYRQATSPPQETIPSIIQGAQLSSNNHGTNAARSEPSAAEKTLQHFREQRRLTQQRYRKRIHSKVISLESDVARLQEELLRIQSILHPPPRVASNTSPWKAVAEFFRLFQNGVEEPVKKDIGSITPLNALYDVQKKFLHVIMAPNVILNDGFGVDAVLKCWSFHSRQHERAEIQLLRLEQGPENAVVAYVNNSTTITENMLRNSLLTDDNCVGERELPSFASKLVGHRLTFRIIVRFVWDDEKGLFESAYHQADMLTPLIKMLGNMQDASTVFSSSLGFY
ncbi:hypothetical protein PC120_g17551 [Phytophthora cactorum]|nr:hypothetical protein PC120_g17551 [Phytophthora cactorum]